MLNEKINKYKEIYSDLISVITRLHNANMPFVIHKGRETGLALRKELRAMESCAKELKRLSQEVCKEAITNKRLEKKRLQEEKKNKKAKKKKNVVDIPRSNS